MKFLLFIVSCLLPAACCFSQLPNSDIWILDIKDSAGQISFHNPVNITNRKGYDNQPAFSPDGTYILYSSQRDSTGPTDIYKYDLKSKKTSPFTKTPTSEYSPTFMPDGKHISVIMVEKDSAQRVWKFPVAGGEPSCIMKNVDSAGYHCWINKDSMAVFVLTRPAFTLQLVNIHSQKAFVIADSIGRTMRTKNGALWFTTKAGHFQNVCEYYPGSRRAYIKGLIEGEDFCFYNKNDIWSLSETSVISGFMNNKEGAPEVADLGKFGITKPARITISPDGKKLAVVSIR